MSFNVKRVHWVAGVVQHSIIQIHLDFSLLRLLFCA